MGLISSVREHQTRERTDARLSCVSWTTLKLALIFDFGESTMISYDIKQASEGLRVYYPDTHVHIVVFPLRYNIFNVRKPLHAYEHYAFA